MCADGLVFSREDVEHGARIPRGHRVPNDGWQNSRCLSPAQLLSRGGSSTTAEGDLCLELVGCCRLCGDQAASSTPPQPPVLQLWCMGWVAEGALGKKSRTIQYQQKTDFLQKLGQEVPVSWATACPTAALAPFGMVLLLCWPQPLVSLLGLAQQPPTLP